TSPSDALRFLEVDPKSALAEVLACIHVPFCCRLRPFWRHLRITSSTSTSSSSLTSALFTSLNSLTSTASLRFPARPYVGISPKLRQYSIVESMTTPCSCALASSIGSSFIACSANISCTSISNKLFIENRPPRISK
uniref:Uncharacterized protein n=1 Tax=Parascaris equorum TaxID=6256 RepID=A0A914R3T4_PAREQ